MERRSGAKANRFMDAVDEAFAEPTGPNQETWQRLYRLKNSDAQMSGYVSAHQCSTLQQAPEPAQLVLAPWVTHDLLPSTATTSTGYLTEQQHVALSNLQKVT